MAVVYQNKSETKVGANNANCIISAPAGFSVGDLLIAVVIKDGNGAITRPAGWTQIQADSSFVAIDVSYRIAQAGDMNWTWTGASEEWYGIILRYTGHDPSTPIHASGKADGSDDAPTAPSVAFTDLEVGSITLQVFGQDGNYTPYTTPGALTERFNDASSMGTGTCGGAGGDKSASGTGSTGTAVFGTASFRLWIAVTAVIEAAAAAAGVAPTSIFIGPFGGPFGGPIQ